MCRLSVLGVVFLFGQCFGARILAIVPTPSYSHQIVFHPLWKELSLRGHQVTFITADPIKDPSLTNLTEIDLHDISYKTWNEYLEGKLEKDSMNIIKLFTVLSEVIIKLSGVQMEQQKIQQLINDDKKKFDVLMVENFSPVMLAFSKRFNCPSIMLQSFDPLNFFYHIAGNPGHPVLNPTIGLVCDEKLTFVDRMASGILHLLVIAISKYYESSYWSLIRSNFGQDYPKGVEFMRNTDMYFISSDQIYARVRPLNPNIIQIGGGIHLQPKKPLPKVNLRPQLHLSGFSCPFNASEL